MILYPLTSQCTGIFSQIRNADDKIFYQNTTILSKMSRIAPPILGNSLKSDQATAFIVMI